MSLRWWLILRWVVVYAIKGEDNDTYYSHIAAALDHKPHITMDDGADLVHALHTDRQDVVEGVFGGTEETTTGVIRLRAMADEGVLKYPIVAVNDAMTELKRMASAEQTPWSGSPVT